MRGMRVAQPLAAALALAVLAVGVKAAHADELVLRLPKDDRVAFRGVVSLDGAGLPNHQLLYPAPNAVGLLAAVLTHSLISGSAQESQKNKLQEEADAVLAPYRGILDSFGSEELMRRSLALMSAPEARRIVPHGDTPGAVDTGAQFYMTQDQKAIILDNLIAGVKSAAAAPAVLVVRVVSDPRAEENVQEHWSADNGERLKSEAARLFAESLQVALRHGSQPADTIPQRTVRYMEGSGEKMERAHVIDRTCTRVIMISLRGALMSVPAKGRAEDCPEAARPN
jgi:hypothetical protein